MKGSVGCGWVRAYFNAFSFYYIDTTIALVDSGLSYIHAPDPFAWPQGVCIISGKKNITCSNLFFYCLLNIIEHCLLPVLAEAFQDEYLFAMESLVPANLDVDSLCANNDCDVHSFILP